MDRNQTGKARPPSRSHADSGQEGVVPLGSGLAVAVVGCGYWGSKHVRVAYAADAVDELVLVDPREDRLEALGHSYRHAPRFASLAQALPHVDAVILATPPSTHVAA